VIRFLSVLLGALPASWLASIAVLAALSAVDSIGLHPVQGTLGVLWGVSGLLGAIGAWLIIFDVGTATTATRRVVIVLVGVGIAAASVALIGLFPALFRLSSPELLFFLCAASAIGVGVFQICRVTAASPWVILGRIAMGYAIGIGFVMAEPLYTNVVDTERLVRWECWDPASCDENAEVPRRHIKYSFPGGSAWYQMEASNGLVAHLKRLDASEVPAKLRVQTRFGVFESFTIVELAGFPIEGGSARNGNQPEPPFPTQGVDDDAGTDQ
jgi:hypothetical protein